MNSRKIVSIATCCIVSLMLWASIMPSGLAELTPTRVSNGSTLSYDGFSSAAYRMYAQGFTITVTDNSSNPIKGSIDFGGDTDVVSDIDLEPYVLDPTWAGGSNNCPIHNDSTSSIVSNWDNNTVTGASLIIYKDAGEFASLERYGTELTFARNFTVQNRLNETLEDTVMENVTFVWDYEFGVLLKYTITITNYNDSSLCGNYGVELSETNLWEIEADIPGYPVVTIMVASVITIATILYQNNKRRNN